MWLEIFVVFNFIVLPYSISCQPVTESIRGTRQTNFEECCPCSRDDGSDFRDPDMSPNSPMGSFTQEADDCPCRYSEIDSQVSPSIFRPFILRNSQPSEREQQLKQKPLLQPEVGLASSVLETIQKATDEEYKEALEREASRSLVEIESGFHDSEPGNSRNSVTIVLNPRDDLYDGDDTIPEASHIHETRCIHSPLGRSSLANDDMIPRMSKQKLFLKRKPVGHLTKSLFDMDNSASNIKEAFAVNNNALSTKLKMNPLLLNNLPTKTGEDSVNDSISKVNSRYELRTMIPEQGIDLKNNELNNSPKIRLAALKSRLRDLVEMRNIKRLNNNISFPLKQSNLDIFSNKDESAAKLEAIHTNSPLDPLFDNASPILKNIMKLKDVELLPPKELFGKHLTEDKLKLSDLNVAGSENHVKISDINEDKNENVAELDTRKVSDSEENVLDQTESEEESTTDVIINNSHGIQTCPEKGNSLTTSKDALIEEMQRRLDDCLKSARKAQVDVYKIDPNDTAEHIEYDSKEADNESEMEDSIAETSHNVNEQISQEEVDNRRDEIDSSNLQKSAEENNNEQDSSFEQEHNSLATFKNEILRKFENMKKSIKSKLQDTNTITKPLISQPINEKNTVSQDLNNLDLNSEGDQNMAVTVTSQPTNEKDVTIQDLQNLSDSLLQQEQENNINDFRIPTPIENETIFEENNEDKDSSINSTNEDKSASSELDPTDTEIDENQASLEDDDDPISNESSLDEKQENNNSESSKYINFQIGDTKDNDNFIHDSDKTLPKDSETNEMSSQASNSKYNTIIAPLDDNLKGPTLQDTFSLFKTPLQIPSLEEIKQGITDIIDAGQKESEDFQQTDFDPLNESSNRNSVLSNPLQSNFPKSNYLGKPLTDRYIRPFQNARNNIAGYKSILDTTSLKPLITEPFDHPSMLRSYPSSLASNRPNFAGNKNLKASSDATSTSSLDDITRFFQNQNLLKPTNINFPKTNLLKSSSFNPQRINSFADDLKYRLDSLKPDFKQANHGNQLLGKPRSEKDDLLLTMSKKHEDMKQKLQALHFDFNDRLASMYKRLNDQKKTQSVNIPTLKTKDNILGLPKTASNKERTSQNLNSNSMAKLDNSFLSQPQLLQDHTSMKKKLTPKPKSTYKVKANTGLLKESENGHISKYPKISENHKLNMNKQKSFTPISKVKISFNTTPKPFSTSSSNLQKSQDPIKIPSRLSESERTADLNSNLKDISKAFRSRFQPFIDLNHSPSELIETKQLNEDLSNSQFGAMNANNQPRINSKQANSDFGQNLKQMQDTTINSIPKKTESPLISNLREALKARLQNITNTHAKPFRNPVESTNLREDDAMVLPSNVKTSVLNNPLLENKSYKCTMICSKDK